MDRQQAIDTLVRDAVFPVAPMHADLVARAFDTTIDRLGIQLHTVEELARRILAPGVEGSVRVKYAVRAEPAVMMHELAARIAVSLGLYANMDHAMQSPHHQAQAECRYIGHRAAIRLARFYFGEQGVTDLRERNPHIDPKLFREPVFRAS